MSRAKVLAELASVTATVAELNALDVSEASGADATTFLRGDATWAAAGSTDAGDLDTGTLLAARLPAGSVVKTYYFLDTSGDVRTNASAAIICCTPMSFLAVSGRKYIINGNQQYATSNETGTSISNRIILFGLWYGTTSRAKLDTEIYLRTEGIAERPAATAGNAQYFSNNYSGFFTAASSVTHYVYTTIHDTQSKYNYAHNDGDRKHYTVIYEVLP